MSKSLSCSGKHYYKITPQDKPFSCPLPTNPLWDAHPRVYLPIAKTEQVTCPYCGTKYFLETKVND